MNIKLKPKLVLGIESSCDDTSAGVVSDAGEVLSNVTYTQFVEHAKFGGVVPEIAARAHLEKIESVVGEALSKANLSLDDIDAIAATAGPGLIGGVIVGTMYAKAIAMARGIPYLAINHLEAHALSARIGTDLEFPYLLLLVSGGHCQFVLVMGPGKHKVLGSTIDDAVGEAFDKTGKLLGFGYPAGPKIEKLALNGDPQRFPLPRPMCNKPGCDFSFSGLKTAARQTIEKLDSNNDSDLGDFCASFQATISDILYDRSKNAIEMAKPYKPTAFVLGGGVAANQSIRTKLERLATENGLKFNAPPLSLCTDNGAMIAWAGIEHFRLGKESAIDFAPRPRWSLKDIE